MLSVRHKAALDAARGRGVRGSGRGARRPAPFMAGPSYRIAADTITAHRAFCHTFVELTMSRLPKEFALLAVPSLGKSPTTCTPVKSEFSDHGSHRTVPSASLSSYTCCFANRRDTALSQDQ